MNKPITDTSNFQIIESPFVSIIADIVRNNKNLTPKLQDAVAAFISYESQPIITFNQPKVLTEKDS